MKFIVLASLLVVSLAAPQGFGSPFFTRRSRPSFRAPARPARPQFRPAPTFRPTPAPFQPRPTPAPAFRATPRPIAIVRDNRQDYGDGNFVYDFQGENGIEVNAQGRPGSRGQTNIEGSFRFPLPEGGVAEVRYVADENGFRADSPLLPVAPPLPAHAIEQIRVAEEQRRRGIIWD